MSFLDKISNGLIIQIVELLNPSKNCSPATLFVEFLTTKSFNAPHNAACGNFYRNIMSFIPGTCAFIILVVLIWLDLPSLSVRRQRGFTP
jgi:hypothetical protein